MNIQSVNPNVLFAGFILTAILTGIGEYFKIVPAGTTAVIIGSIFGGGIAHVSFAMGNNAAQAANPPATVETSPPTGGTTT